MLCELLKILDKKSLEVQIRLVNFHKTHIILFLFLSCLVFEAKLICVLVLDAKFTACVGESQWNRNGEAKAIEGS